ncbi:Eukaryotic-type carbonic anhydrase [Popillia japonica]|uniref:carbonic anhydrase n=1 Tax=Popillia japonica TaxID=7064 RepID=A0AAW1N4R8_POPJA
MTTLNLLRRRQSPIDIDAKSAVSTTINPLSFSEHYGHIPENIELSISNQGFTIIPSYKEHNKPNIVGGPLDTAYELQQFHLHWGSGHKDEAVNLINKDRSDRTVPLTTKFPMNEIIKPFSSNYYTYDGSWTTPPFTENVTWLIPTEILTFPKEYLKSFRKITASNRRELQDRYDRKILHALN